MEEKQTIVSPAPVFFLGQTVRFVSQLIVVLTLLGAQSTPNTTYTTRTSSNVYLGSFSESLEDPGFNRDLMS